MKLQPKLKREGIMQRMKWIAVWAAGIFLFTASAALAQDHGKGHGKGHEKHGDDDDNGSQHYYKAHDRDEIHGWYVEHANNLPPGLAKRDRLPPGLERQLVLRGTLPPGLQKKIQPVPVELERVLRPPPPECGHVLIGGHIVLLNRRTNVVLDFVHVEEF